MAAEGTAVLVIGLLGMLAFTAVSLAVGVRLLWLARRTTALPELCIGASFLLAGGIGGVLTTLAGPEHRALYVVGSFAIDLGLSFLAVFNWRVFRPDSPWAAAACFACIAAFAAAFLGRAVAGSFGAGSVSGWDWLSVVARMAMYAWGAGESLLHHAAGRRRLRLGLADPLVVNRFLLWAIGLLAVFLIWVQLAFVMAAGADPRTTFLGTALLGFVCAGSLWLAFFPPAAWRRRFTDPSTAR